MSEQDSRPGRKPPLALRLELHPSVLCGACKTELWPKLGQLDQSGPPLDAAVYTCNDRCGWARAVKLLSIEPSKDEAGHRSIEVGLKGEF